MPSTLVEVASVVAVVVLIADDALQSSSRSATNYVLQYVSGRYV